MANIYITDETLQLLDEAVEKYNEKNAPTDRSGYIKYMLTKKNTENKK